MSNNGIVQIHGKDYMTVAKRVELFLADVKDWKDKGGYSIETEIIPNDTNHVVIKATVRVGNVIHTGISSIDLNSTKMIEKSNPYEVAETSAVGRALGFAGYGIIEGIASADEMAKVTTQQTPEGVITTTEEPPMPTEEMPAGKKVCSAHDVPEQMFEGKSKTKTNADGTPKAYWWHKKGEQMCFGQGYMD